MNRHPPASLDSSQPNWKSPRLEGLTFFFTGELPKEPRYSGPLTDEEIAHRVDLAGGLNWDSQCRTLLFRGERLTEQTLRWIVEREGGTVLAEIRPDLNYVLRLGENYPPKLRNEIDDMNYSQGTRIRQVEVSVLFEELLWPGRTECLAMLRGGREGAARFSELMEYALPGQTVDIRGNDMQNLDLQQVDLRRTVLDGVNLSGANLAGARLPDASNVVLDGTDLTNARFDKLKNSSLVGANLTGATRCRFVGCNLNEARLSGITFEQCASCSFRNANLEGAIWRSAPWNLDRDAEAPDFTGASMRNMRFTFIALPGAVFRAADLENASFYQTNLTGADLREANCRGSHFGYANLEGARVAGADFTGAILRMCDLDRVDINAANGLEDARLLPGGEIGPQVRELERICSESQRISFQGTAKTETQRIEFELYYEKRPSAYYVGGEWRLYDEAAEEADPLIIHILPGVDAAEFTDYLMKIAGYWTDASVQWKTIKVSSKKAAVKGRELKKLVVAAIGEAWGKTPP